MPKNLAHITFGTNFNKKIEKLPNSLVEIGFNYGSDIKNNIPNYVSSINIYFDFIENPDENEGYISNIPSNIKIIKINNKRKVHLIKKIPFNCVVYDLEDNILLSD